MPHLYGENMHVEIDDIVVSRSVKAVRWEETVTERERTGLQDRHRRWGSRLFDGEVTVEWLADYHTGGIYRTIQPLLGKTVRMKVRPHGPVESADNPTHAADVHISSLPLMDVAIGELSTFHTTWRLSGPVTRTPAPIWQAEMVVGQAGASVRGFKSRESITFGTLTPAVIPADVIPGYDQDATVTQITWNGTTELRIYFTNNAQADALHGLYLVANPLSMHLDPSPGTDEWYASTTFPDGDAYPQPGWGTGDRVRIELWNANPDVH